MGCAVPKTQQHPRPFAVASNADADAVAAERLVVEVEEAIAHARTDARSEALLTPTERGEADRAEEELRATDVSFLQAAISRAESKGARPEVCAAARVRLSSSWLDAARSEHVWLAFGNLDFEKEPGLKRALERLRMEARLQRSSRVTIVFGGSPHARKRNALHFDKMWEAAAHVQRLVEQRQGVEAVGPPDEVAELKEALHKVALQEASRELRTALESGSAERVRETLAAAERAGVPDAEVIDARLAIGQEREHDVDNEAEQVLHVSAHQLTLRCHALKEPGGTVGGPASVAWRVAAADGGLVPEAHLKPARHAFASEQQWLQGVRKADAPDGMAEMVQLLTRLNKSIEQYQAESCVERGLAA